jgi:TonB family protein
MTMGLKIKIPLSALVVLLCAAGALAAQDPQIQAPPADKPDASTAAPAPSPRPMRVRIGGNVAATMITHQVQPKYPDEAKHNHVAGTIVLRTVVSLDGHVQQLQFLSGPPELMRSAMDAVRQWRYKPMKLNGKVVEFETTISVVYTLSD